MAHRRGPRYAHGGRELLLSMRSNQRSRQRCRLLHPGQQLGRRATHVGGSPAAPDPSAGRRAHLRSRMVRADHQGRPARLPHRREASAVTPPTGLEEPGLTRSAGRCRGTPATDGVLGGNPHDPALCSAERPGPPSIFVHTRVESGARPVASTQPRDTAQRPDCGRTYQPGAVAAAPPSSRGSVAAGSSVDGKSGRGSSWWQTPARQSSRSLQGALEVEAIPARSLAVSFTGLRVVARASRRRFP